MTVAGSSSALDALLGFAGVDLTPERMQWMVLTWDLSLVNQANSDFYRVFLTLDAALTVTGTRTTDVFGTITPKVGTVEDFVIAPPSDPLETALIRTDDAIEDGHEMLCRPLAVDCSTFAGGFETGQPYEMLSAMSFGSRQGRRVLGHINAARRTAFSTHVSPEAHRNRFRDAEELWLGR